MSSSISLLTAFLAGLASFLSPCVLPIVPGYLSFISGVNVAQLKGAEPPAHLMRRIAIMSLVFVLGFSTVFVSLGAAATLLGYYMQQYKRELAVVGGAVVVVLGLHTAGFVKIPWLLYERRAEMRERPLGMPGAYLVGLAFGFGWTPCIGPILAAILSIAAAEATVTKGAGLLAVYSLGLGIPFLLAAFMIEQFSSLFARMKRHLDTVERAMGVLMVITGIGFLTGAVSNVSIWLLETFPALQNFG